MPIGADWINILPSVQAFVHGQNPYLVGEVFEPFWTYLLLSPLTLVSFAVGRYILFGVSLLVFFLTSIKMGATRFQIILFMLSSAVIGCLNNGNLDWMITSGFWMPPQIGLFFVLMKPQVGIGIAIYWAYAAWKGGGFKKVVWTFAPVVIAYLFSFMLYGFWIMRLIGMNENRENMSSFPWAVPMGIFIMLYALRKKDEKLSILPGTLVAPYTSQFSYSASLLSLTSRPKLFIFAWIVLWIPVLIRFI